MSLTDEDWDLLSAYADGELDGSTRRALEARMKTDAVLVGELDRIRRSKRALAGLRPELAPPPKTSRWFFSALPMAACIVLAFGIAGTAFWMMETAGLPNERKAQDWHTDFAAKSYVVEQGGLLKLAAGASLGIAGAPDLSASNLVLVDVKIEAVPEGEVIAMHYRGFRGCRLTLVAEPRNRKDRDAGNTGLFRSWTTAKSQFRLIADSMDPERFAALAGYIEDEIRQREADERLRVALADATATATPCG